MTTRTEHLNWCKQRALQLANCGDSDGAVASMISDLSKWREPLYDKSTLTTLTLDGMMFRKTVADVKNWIEGFG